MKNLLIAAALMLSATGFAAAEGARLYSNNYSASVLAQYGAPEVVATADLVDIDRISTASIVSDNGGHLHGNYSANVLAEDVRGR